jgi:hypothetical protein
MAKSVARQLSTVVIWVESRHPSKIINGRHKRRSGRHTLARQISGRKSAKIFGGRRSANRFTHQSPRGRTQVKVKEKVVCHEVFYWLSSKINYNVDLIVFRFPRSVVKMKNAITSCFD